MARTTFDEAIGLLPGVQRRLADLEREIWAPGRCDAALLRLSQQRVAQLLGDHDAAGEPIDAASLDQRARACLAFTELYVIDPHAVTDEITEELLTHVTPEEATALTMALAVFDATSRARVALGLVV